MSGSRPFARCRPPSRAQEPSGCKATEPRINKRPLLPSDRTGSAVRCCRYRPAAHSDHVLKGRAPASRSPVSSLDIYRPSDHRGTAPGPAASRPGPQPRRPQPSPWAPLGPGGGEAAHAWPRRPPARRSRGADGGSARVEAAVAVAPPAAGRHRDGGWGGRRGRRLCNGREGPGSAPRRGPSRSPSARTGRAAPTPPFAATSVGPRAPRGRGDPSAARKAPSAPPGPAASSGGGAALGAPVPAPLSPQRDAPAHRQLGGLRVAALRSRARALPAAPAGRAHLSRTSPRWSQGRNRTKQTKKTNTTKNK